MLIFHEILGSGILRVAFSSVSTDLDLNVAIITTGIRENVEKLPLEEMLIFYTK